MSVGNGRSREGDVCYYEIDVTPMGLQEDRIVRYRIGVYFVDRLL